MDLLQPYLELIIFFYLPMIIFDKEITDALHWMSGIFSCGIRQLYTMTNKRTEIPQRQVRGSTACRFKDVKIKSQRTLMKLIESPTQIPYFTLILVYWFLLVISNFLPKWLYIPWVLHCSLDQLVVLFRWWRCYRNFHQEGLQDVDTFQQTGNYLLAEDFQWKQHLENDCLILKKMIEKEQMFYSVESPLVMQSYMGVEEDARRLIRIRKAAILQELKKKLTQQMAKIQELMKQCEQAEGQKHHSSLNRC